MPEKYGDILAQSVALRVAPPTATTTTLAAIGESDRADGMRCMVLTDSSEWVFDADSSATASNDVVAPGTGSGRWLRRSQATQAGAMVRYVRGVVTANVADLTAFTVASNDGLTYSAGQRVLLAGQSTAAQNGIYVVGTVASTTAPLTRAADMPASSTIVNGSVVEASEGTLWAGSSWKAMCTGTAVIGTNDPVFYPRTVHFTTTLVAGTKTCNTTQGVWLFSTTKSQVLVTYNTPGTTTASVGLSAPVASRTAGKQGTAAIIINAIKADATTDTDNVSSVDVLIVNA